MEPSERPSPASAERSLFDDLGVVEQWVERATAVGPCVASDATLAEWAGRDPVVFEGAHGVLLDETFGFHPHTTWSRCTSSTRSSTRACASATAC